MPSVLLEEVRIALSPPRSMYAKLAFQILQTFAGALPAQSPGIQEKRNIIAPLYLREANVQVGLFFFLSVV